MIKEFAIATPNKPIDSSIFFAETGCNLYIRDEQFYISDCQSQADADSLIAAHNPTPASDNSSARTALLAKLGITADEAKLLLS